MTAFSPSTGKSDLKPTSKPFFIKEGLDKIIPKLSIYKALFFIDIDNVASSIKLFDKILLEMNNPSCDFHLICFYYLEMKLNKLIKSLMGYQCVTIISNSTIGPDASDANMIMATIILDQECKKINSNIPFYIITKDQFYIELDALLTSFSRKTIVSRYYTVDFLISLLLDSNINISFKDLLPNMYKQILYITIKGCNTLDNMLKCIQSLLSFPPNKIYTVECFRVKLLLYIITKNEWKSIIRQRLGIEKKRWYEIFNI